MFRDVSELALPAGDPLARALGATGNASSVSIKKFDEEQQLVYGEVYAPGFLRGTS